MTDTSEWAGNLSAESRPSLQDFDLLSQQMGNVYVDQNRRRMEVIKLMQ
jgi:hypothetical protein